jgi:CpeS-like protein
MPNLRLRTSVVKQADGNEQASFCSEIRMGVSAKNS